jgi:sulfopropanediol 3-dehydrogenase
MAITYLKKSPKTSSTDDTKTTGIVQDLLKDIEKTKEQGCIELTKKFDKYDGEIVISKERIEEIKKTLDQKTKDDIQFSYDRVRKFAEAQLKNYGQNFEVELSDGVLGDFFRYVIAIIFLFKLLCYLRQFLFYCYQSINLMQQLQQQ